MNELLERIWDEVYAAWRYRWLALGLATLIALGGWLFVFSLDDRYEANASVFVDTRTALRPVLQGLAVEQDVNVQLNFVRQSLLSGGTLERIARQSGVLPEHVTDPRAVAEILGPFSWRVQLNVRSASPSGRDEREAGSIYSFRYQDEDRERSVKVTQVVVDNFVEETLGGRRAGAEGAQKFVESELKELEQRLRLAEDRRAEFQRKHLGIMSTEQGGYVMQLQNTVDAIATLQNNLTVAQARRAELARQLRGDAVISAAPSPTSTGAGNDTVSRINEAKARLDELLLRYTDRHQDVIAQRATLADLEARRVQEIQQLRAGDASAAASSGVSSNPVYQSILQQQNMADVEIASLRGQVAQQRAKEADLRARMDVAPQVEAEYAQLNRDYEVVKAQYTAMLENYEKAQLGERADDAGSVRFEIVQPAAAAYTPVYPNRPIFLAGVMLVALAAGAGCAWLLHALNPVVLSTRGLADLTELPVVGVVSPAFPREMAAKARGEIFRFVFAGSVLAATFIGVVVLNELGVRLPGGTG